MKITQHKSQAVEMLGEFKRHVAGVNQLIINALRSDQGEEFSRLIFKEFCKRNGIKQEFTVRYSPHQNGRPECLWRMLMNIMRRKMNE